MPGGVVTVSGTRISLAVTPTDVVVGSSTLELGGLILSGIGGGGGSPTVAPFRGEAGRVGSGLRWVVGMSVIVGSAIMLI